MLNVLENLTADGVVTWDSPKIVYCILEVCLLLRVSAFGVSPRGWFFCVDETEKAVVLVKGGPKQVRLLYLIYAVVHLFKLPEPI